MNHLGARVSALVDGQLGHAERDRALAHVAHCATCRAAVDAERTVKALLADATLPAPSNSLLASLHGLAEPGGPVSPQPRSMPLGPVVPTLPPPGRGPFGSRRDSRRPAGSSRSRRAQRVRYAAAGAVSVAGLVLGTAFAAGGSSGAGAGPVVPPAAELSVEHAATTSGFPLGDPAFTAVTASFGGLSVAPDPATVKRTAVSTGPIAVLGPLALLSLFLLSGSSSAVAGTAAGRALPTSDARAMQLLDRAGEAPETVSYRGVQFVSAWTSRGSTGLVVDVVHRPGYGTTVSSSATAWTRAERTHLAADGAAPSLLGGASTLSLLSSHFSLSVEGSGSVAGRAVDVVVVTKPGAAWPTARFWLDTETGLVLRREVYDESGRTTRASAFVEIAVGETEDYNDAAESAQDTGRPTAWPDAIDPSDLQRMRDRGWKCPDKLPPSLQLIDARRGGGHYDGIVHLSYSDGLASVSVFEQRGRLRASDLTDYRATTVGGRHVYLRDGVPQRLVWASHGTVYTVVADASARTVGDVVGALPRPTDDTGAMNRLGRGLDRVASWFNPFG